MSVGRLFSWVLVLFSLSIAAAKLPPPYDSITMLLPYRPYVSHDRGWFQENNRVKLEHIIQSEQVHTAVEVGSWLGNSTLFIASELPESGKLYAVDHWQGSIEHIQADWLQDVIPVLYEQFLSNVIHKGLTHKIIPMRMDSLHAANALRDLRPDLVYIDAAHDTQSVLSDLRAWYPLVKGHGVLCGDDYGWASVQDALNIFCQEENLRIEPFGAFWRLYPND